MDVGRTVFAQLMAQAPHKEFQRCVARYGGDRYLTVASTIVGEGYADQNITLAVYSQALSADMRALGRR